MVHLLLEMKSNLDAIVQQAFQKNEGFANALKEAFENFINQRQNKYGSPLLAAMLATMGLSLTFPSRAWSGPDMGKADCCSNSVGCGVQMQPMS